MRAVECATCGNQVLCEKFSIAHTSVQWTADAAVVCAEFRDRVGRGATSARIRTCRALRVSIDRAVEDGALRIGTLESGALEPGASESGTPGAGTPAPGAPRAGTPGTGPWSGAPVAAAPEAADA